MTYGKFGVKKNGFPKVYRLRKAAEFSSVFHARSSCHGRYFQLIFKPNASEISRLGLIVSKKIARTSPKRNDMKRFCREYFRCHKDKYVGFDIIIRLKLAIIRLDHAVAREELTFLLQRMRLAPVKQIV